MAGDYSKRYDLKWSELSDDQKLKSGSKAEHSARREELGIKGGSSTSAPTYGSLTPEEKREYGNRETYRVNVLGKDPRMPATVERLGGRQEGYGAMIGADPDTSFTTEFLDVDGDLIDDRRQYRAGLPDSVRNPGAMMGDQYIGTSFGDLGENPKITEAEYGKRKTAQRMALDAIGNSARDQESFEAVVDDLDLYGINNLADFDVRAAGAGGTMGRGYVVETGDIGKGAARLSAADLRGLQSGDQNWFASEGLPAPGEEGYLPDDLAAKAQLLEYADAGVEDGSFVSGAKAQALKDKWASEIAAYVYEAPEETETGDTPPPTTGGDDPPPVTGGNPPSTGNPVTGNNNIVITTPEVIQEVINSEVGVNQSLVQNAIAQINMGDYNQEGAFSGNTLSGDASINVQQNQTAGDAIATNNGANNAYVVSLADPNRYTGSSSNYYFGSNWPFG